MHLGAGPDQRCKKPLEDGDVPVATGGKGQRIGRNRQGQWAEFLDTEPARPGKGPGVARNRRREQLRAKAPGQGADQSLRRGGNPVGQNVIGGAPPGGPQQGRGPRGQPMAQGGVQADRG